LAGSSKKVHGATFAASVAFHAVVGLVLFWLAIRSLGPAPSPPAEEGAGDAQQGGTAPIAIELPSVGDVILLDDRAPDPTGDPPKPSGGSTIARLDKGKAGRGGDPTTPSPALNLADDNDRTRLSPDVLSRLDRDQIQRMRVARARQSWEDRRSTTHPAELTLVVTGSATRLERRPTAASDPSRGALESPVPSVRGGDLGAGPRGDSAEAEASAGSAQRGSVRSAPGSGVDDGRPGMDHRAAAAIGSARPDVTQGPVAVPAADPARPRDDVDSDQEVATTVRSLLHASTAGGTPDEGQGGNGGGGEPGAGANAGVGSRARPAGLGEGEVVDFWTSDPRLMSYFRQLHAKIDPLWAHAFPKSALLELKQGTVILQFTVQADGRASVQWPPARPSGVDEFDRNCADAIRRAAPFPPIPRELGVNSLTIRAPFVANNPIVK
jgi:TonB family protein